MGEAMFTASVYAVLYKSGRVKVGYSSNMFQRLRAHIQHGKSFGDDVDMMFFTEPHESAKETESQLIDFFSQKASKVTAEYFEGADRWMVREVMVATKRMVCWCSALSVRGDCAMVPADALGFERPSEERIQDDESEKIKDRIFRSVTRYPGVTGGVLKNRFRRIDPATVDAYLEELVSESLIVAIESPHPKRVNEKFFKYYAREHAPETNV